MIKDCEAGCPQGKAVLSSWTDNPRKILKKKHNLSKSSLNLIEGADESLLKLYMKIMYFLKAYDFVANSI